jgi:hypothetical protein
LLLFAGGSDAEDDDRVRNLLRELARNGPLKLLGGYSPGGGVCQACGNRIKVGAIEYEVETTGSRLRIDAACYRLLVQEMRGDIDYGSREAAGS